MNIHFKFHLNCIKIVTCRESTIRGPNQLNEFPSDTCQYQKESRSFGDKPIFQVSLKSDKNCNLYSVRPQTICGQLSGQTAATSIYVHDPKMWAYKKCKLLNIIIYKDIQGLDTRIWQGLIRKRPRWGLIIHKWIIILPQETSVWKEQEKK